MSEPQEYYINGDYVTIWGEVKDKPDMVIVTTGDDYGALTVVRRKDLTPKEKSWTFQQAQKRADELRLITQKAEENFNKVVEKVIESACTTLSTRMKMNILFGQGGNGWAVAVADELNKLVKKDAKEVVEKEST